MIPTNRDTILILSNTQDEEAAKIADVLVACETAKVFVLQTDLLHTDYHFAVHINHNQFSITNIHTQQQLHSEEIKTIWWSRPESIDLKVRKIDKNLQDFIRREYTSTLYSFITCLEQEDVLIVSNPFHTYRASNKIYQQIVARQVGMAVPNQVITNDKTVFADFYTQQENCIFKPIFNSTYITKDKKQFFTYPTVITSALYQAIIEDEIDFHVYHFQEKLEFVEEYRVVLFGQQLFVFKICGEYEMDWRKDMSKIYLEYVTDFALQEACFEYAKKMNIVFGCFDFIATQENIYFIECNVPGYFLFCDKDGKIGLAKEFAKFLNRHEDL